MHLRGKTDLQSKFETYRMVRLMRKRVSRTLGTDSLLCIGSDQLARRYRDRMASLTTKVPA